MVEPIRLVAFLLKAPIHVYRWTLKPLVGHSCRHWPTCSAYALEAIDTNGAWRGFWLMVSRLVRCGPGGTHGVDPVPNIRAEHHTFAPWRYGRWRAVFPSPLVGEGQDGGESRLVGESGDSLHLSFPDSPHP